MKSIKIYTPTINQWIPCHIELIPISNVCAHEGIIYITNENLNIKQMIDVPDEMAIKWREVVFCKT